MPNWTTLGKLHDFSQADHTCITIENISLVVCPVDNTFHVILNACPHAGLPLGQGELRGKVITCPYHGYAYNVTNGRNIDWPHDEPPIKTFPVRIEGDTLQADLTSSLPNTAENI
ncbi:Rieske (2Fe-2S) protein [Poriferisphaera sp. WC338]|uniref:Rieske (2Fe-2S) protein n=1 Tax=Poriferisphaera sp. WC338 TaxID=3425129 RepID=UPI003D814CDB